MKNKPIVTLFLMILLAGFGLNACNRDRVEAAREPDSVNDRANMLTADDKEFVAYASEMHVGEIDMAKQAKHKSESSDVLAYADTVIRAHSDALKDLSDVKGTDPSKEASWDTKSHMQFLATLSGPEFDRQFITLMVADHKSASETFRHQIGATQNADLKNYLEDTASSLESRLQDARQLESKVGTPVTTR